MEVIERYIYAVTQKLPQSQRADIEVELRGLIEDMLEERAENHEITEKDVESVLLALGNPRDLAAKYRGDKQYLVGPDLFHTYLSILKIVLFAITVAMSIVFVMETIMDPIAILGHFIGFIISMISAGTQAFAWITIGFAIAEYNGVKPNKLKKELQDDWKPADLPPIPTQKKQIKRSETIIGIIFSVIALVFIIFSNHLFGVLAFENNKLIGIVPFLNLEAIDEFMPIIYLLVAVGILKECLKLIIGNWTKQLALYNLLFNLATTVLVILLVRDQLIWNPTFVEDMADFYGITNQEEAYFTINQIWQNATKWTVNGFFIVLFIDTFSGFFKALKK